MRSGFLPQDDFNAMIGTAVSKALTTDDLDEFISWFRGEVARRSSALGEPLDPDGARSLGTVLGRAIWTATPAPHNGFKPQPLPAPGRNEPCVCGSGRKFKRCCGGGPPLPVIQSAEIWPFVLEALPADDVEAAVGSGGVPTESLLMAADRALANDRPKLGVSLLEPLFKDRIRGFDERYDHAFTILCNLYDALGHARKKRTLLTRVVDEAPRSPLRSGAYQRLATIELDSGDSAAAWAAFRSAQRDDPDSPMIGALEVQLLIGEHRIEEARERARVWRKHLQRRNADDFEGLVEFLTRIIDDPYSAVASTMIGEVDEAGGRLGEAMRGLAARALPAYALVRAEDVEPAGDVKAQITERLRSMGVSGAQLDMMAGDLFEQLHELEPPEDGGDENETAEIHFCLVPPPELRTLEADWHAIFPLGKPFSVQLVPEALDDPWDRDVEDVWMGFLERHPEAFDSIDILDDLATAVELHPMSEMLGVRNALQQPLVERATGILSRALDSADLPEAGILPWPDTSNRPVLRCLFQAQRFAQESGDDERARALAERLLRLNPADNHGVRGELMNMLLRANEDNAALELALRYEDDVFAELPYGRVLALARLGRDPDARVAAAYAVEKLPEVRKFLTRERARPPKLSPHGITIGGKDQAWLYREEMRDVWLAEPAAMALIKKARAG